MDLYEYQAKSLFAKGGVPVQRGIAASTPAEASMAYRELGVELVMVKAQMKTGGRGKTGGVKLARNADETETMAQDILGIDVKDHPVHRVLIAKGVDIEREFYFPILLDRVNRQSPVMCSVEGGVEIKRLAKEKPEALAKVPTLCTGIDKTLAVEITQQADFNPETGLKIVSITLKLQQTYADKGATLTEVNPSV